MLLNIIHKLIFLYLILKLFYIKRSYVNQNENLRNWFNKYQSNINICISKSEKNFETTEINEPLESITKNSNSDVEKSAFSKLEDELFQMNNKDSKEISKERRYKKHLLHQPP